MPITINDAAQALRSAIQQPTLDNCEQAVRAIARFAGSRVAERMTEAGLIDARLIDGDKPYAQALAEFVAANTAPPAPAPPPEEVAP